MKQICIVLCFIACCLVHSQDDFKDQDSLIQSQNIKEKLTYNYYPPEFQDSIMTQSNTYNSNGKLTKTYFHNSNTVIYAKMVYTYNEMGLKATSTYFKGSDKISSSTFLYDSINRLTKTISKNSDGSIKQISNTHYFKNNLVSRVDHEKIKNGKLSPLRIIEYDSINRVQETENYSTKGKLQSKLFYDYDIDRNRVVIYSDRNKNKLSMIKKYDKDHRLIQTFNFKTNTKIVYGYDERGLLYYKVNYINDVVNYVTRYVYRTFSEKPSLIFPSRKL